ncbi:hypothetical protein AMJ71_07095 [candidate division TA06 bacterium SM1_40]|uniref:Uncharacterized protein n=2 Tax=Bacteria division TA06 TaxID=1156500 RepID=A0A0S8JKB1_UNCT6|nr:MAG: hypothetical protein AMJ82_10775 [candidate division TA06 bacterium SM23_40]KPL09181.1 MAG: hypothetical protein AMJ71_07095 [candidate division TA06 bacterium SM1_40]
MYGLTSGEQLIYVTLSNAVSLLGALMLWIALLCLGIVARRYERALRMGTGWWYLVVAPMGFLFFAAVQAYARFVQGKLWLGSPEAWTGAVTFFASSVFSLIGILRFYRVAARGARGGIEA